MMNPGDFAAFGSVPEIRHLLVKPFDPAETSEPEYHQHPPRRACIDGA